MDSDSANLFLSGKSILIVEDEAIISFLLEDMMAELGGSDIAHAATVAAALDAIARKTPHIAVLDLNLGGELAYPIAEKLNELSIPFVFTTGYGRDGVDARWGAKAVVQKPFDVQAMQAALRDALEPA